MSPAPCRWRLGPFTDLRAEQAQNTARETASDAGMGAQGWLEDETLGWIAVPPGSNADRNTTRTLSQALGWPESVARVIN